MTSTLIAYKCYKKWKNEVRNEIIIISVSKIFYCRSFLVNIDRNSFLLKFTGDCYYI